MLTAKSNIDVNHFYKHGYDEWMLPQELKTMSWGAIYTEDWNKHSVYKNVPAWSINTDITTPPKEEREYNREYEKAKSASSLDVVPSVYVDVITSLFDNPYYSNWFKDTCGFEYELRFIDLWNGSDELKYHWDGVEDHDLGFLIYLTDEPNWKEEYGSILKIAERDYPNTEVYNEQSIIPNDGKVILLNNVNPRFVHSVNTLQDKTKNRYTLNGGISVWN